MSQRGRLRARQLPTAVVRLPAAEEGGEPEEIRLRALPPVRWDELVAAHPPTAEQEARGDMWNAVTFRPALLAASVLTPPEEKDDALTEADWAEAADQGWMNIGELVLLFDTALELNDRSPLVSVGKG